MPSCRRCVNGVCRWCHGYGYEMKEREGPCRSCHGRGQHMIVSSEGRPGVRRCRLCDGSGVERLEVKMPCGGRCQYCLGW